MTISALLRTLTKTSLALMTLSVIGLGSSSAAIASTVLLQDNFDTENGGFFQLNYDNFAKWNVKDGSLDVIGNDEYDFLPGNGLYLDMDGTTSDAGKLESKTTFTFNPGDNINLTFKLAGDQRDDLNNSVIVSLGSLLTETLALSSSVGFTTYTRSIAVAEATSARLTFDATGGDNVGMLLDDVELSINSSKPKRVPEPGSILSILAAGAGGATSLIKRKQKAEAKA